MYEFEINDSDIMRSYVNSQMIMCVCVCEFTNRFTYDFCLSILLWMIVWNFKLFRPFFHARRAHFCCCSSQSWRPWSPYGWVLGSSRSQRSRWHRFWHAFDTRCERWVHIRVLIYEFISRSQFCLDAVGSTWLSCPTGWHSQSEVSVGQPGRVSGRQVEPIILPIKPEMQWLPGPGLVTGAAMAMRARYKWMIDWQLELRPGR